MVFFVVLFQHQPTSHDQWDYVVAVFNIYAFSKLMCQFLKVVLLFLPYSMIEVVLFDMNSQLIYHFDDLYQFFCDVFYRFSHI